MRKLFLLSVLLCSGLQSFAQSSANSPYSSFGMGEAGGLDHGVFGAMGNSNISLQDSNVVNYYNPSSYSSMAAGQPIFSLGFSTRFSTFTENGNTSFEPLAGLQHFAFGVPFAKRFGLGFGLKPFTRKGYEFSRRLLVGEDSLYYNYSGSGTINDVFLGFSADLLKSKNTRLSIGVQGSYLFGHVTDTRKSGLIQGAFDQTNYEGGVGIKTLRATTFHYTAGLSFEQRFKDKHTLGIYLVVDPQQKISGSYTDELHYAYDLNNPSTYDTLYYNDTLSGSLSSVPTYNIGLKYQLNFISNKGDINEHKTEIGFHLGFTMAQWSQYQDRFDPNFSNGFLDAQKFNFGVQYVPDVQSAQSSGKSKYYHRMRYRIGAYYQTLPYSANNLQVTDFGTTFGIGFPVALNRSLSSVNIGFNYGNRGVADPTALKEQYYGFNIGLLIAPGESDKWFRKRKLN